MSSQNDTPNVKTGSTTSPHLPPRPERVPPSQPRNKLVEGTKLYGSKYDDFHAHGPPPDAPNRNLVYPTTRASTPSRDAPAVRVTHTPQSIRRPTAEEELKNLHKEFKGTSSLHAYDVGNKLGEGTFG
jgi:hypothetical protein